MTNAKSYRENRIQNSGVRSQNLEFALNLPRRDHMAIRAYRILVCCFSLKKYIFLTLKMSGGIEVDKDRPGPRGNRSDPPAKKN